MTTALCIVDMQYKFSSHEECLEGVLYQIYLAKRRNAPIVVLEYEDYGPTHDRIQKALENYSEVSVVIKSTDDGSREFLGEFDSDPDFDRVRVVGVNTCYCVFETAAGLISEGFIVEIPKSATACTCGYERHANPYEYEDWE